jgi:Uma2 family endonuclease
MTDYPTQDAPMTIATTIPDQSTQAQGDQCVVLRDIGWKGYSAVLRLRGDRSIPRMIYLDGSLYLMSPTFSHEHLKERLGSFVMVVAEELDVHCIAAGSTTFRRRGKRGGIEGDQSYYFANLAHIRGKKRIRLRTDPPPDLAIESVWTHGADEAVEVYRRFRVPEVWICDEDQLTILVLQPNGRYAVADRSSVFPVLGASEIHAWVVRSQDDDDIVWIKELRRWVREVLAPRHREQLAR